MQVRELPQLSVLAFHLGDPGSPQHYCFTPHLPGQLVCKLPAVTGSWASNPSARATEQHLARRGLPRHSHFLEEVPVSDDLQLLQDEEDATADEESLVLGQRLIEQQQIALTEQGEHHMGPSETPEREGSMVLVYVCHLH